MNLALVSPVTVELEGRQSGPVAPSVDASAYTPSVGVLTLASVLRKAGFLSAVFDLNGFVRDQYLNRKFEVEATLSRAAMEIKALNATVVGFGTICSSYPMTIRLAEQLKRLAPDTKIVFGGPQASVVDVPTLEAFSFIDCVVRGEAEETIVPTLENLSLGLPIRALGVTYRDGSRIVRNPNASPVQCLDQIPSPAFELSRSVESCVSLPIEAGRGCPFACTFCSTNDFFRRRFRLRSPARVLEEMDRLCSTYGVIRFDLVHDMFTVDRKRVEDFCRAFRDSGKNYRWRCSARSDCVDPELLDLMAYAGCEAIFFGVETGSARLQRIIDKDLDIDEARKVIKSAISKEISCTVALILGFPEETTHDVSETVSFGLDMARLERADVQVGLLAPLAGTPLHSQYRNQMFFDGIYSDMSHQTWEQSKADRALIEEYPEIFPNFYSLPSKNGREYIAELRRFLIYGLDRCRWLMVAIGDTYPDVTTIFDLWIKWREPKRCRFRYYGTCQFPKDLCAFISEMLTMGDRHILKFMVSYYEVLYKIAEVSRSKSEPSDAPQILTVGARSVQTWTFPFCPSLVIRSLQEKSNLPVAGFRETLVAFKQAEPSRVEPYELPPVGAAVLKLCDGQNTVLDIVNALGSQCPVIPGLSPSEVIAKGLLLLREQGLVTFEDAYAGTSR